MATLTVKVTVAGAAGTGLTVKVSPQADFIFNPQRGQAAPNSAATASGTTDGTGTSSLTGLSSVAYQLLVVDARGVNNWFPVGGQYLNGTYYAVIPWTTPATTTSQIDAKGGDTPGTAQPGPWASAQHVHAIPPTTDPATNTAARVTLNGAQSVPTGDTVVAFDTVTYDPGSCWDATNHQYVVPGSGLYAVHGLVVYGYGAINNPQGFGSVLEVVVSGVVTTTVVGGESVVLGATSLPNPLTPACPLNDVLELSAGNRLQLLAYNNGPSAVALASANLCRLAVEQIG